MGACWAGPRAPLQGGPPAGAALGAGGVGAAWAAGWPAGGAMAGRGPLAMGAPFSGLYTPILFLGSYWPVLSSSILTLASARRPCNSSVSRM